MLRELQEAKDYVKDSTASIRKARAANMAFIANLFLDTINLIFKQLEFSGFVGLKLIERSEAIISLSRATTTDKEFIDAIKLIMLADGDFKNTKLFAAMQIIRGVSGGATDVMYLNYIVLPANKTQAQIANDIDELKFFTGFLIESILQQLRNMRSNLKLSKIDADGLIGIFDNQYDSLVISLVQKIVSL